MKGVEALVEALGVRLPVHGEGTRLLVQVYLLGMTFSVYHTHVHNIHYIHT